MRYKSQMSTKYILQTLILYNSKYTIITKLRTYNSFKTSFGRENYVALGMCKHLRSILAQFRCGILPLRIETGRYHGEPVEDTLCKLCSRTVQKTKFTLYMYTDFRSKLVDSTGCNFMPQSSDRDILCILISNHPRQVS